MLSDTDRNRLSAFIGIRTSRLPFMRIPLHNCRMRIYTSLLMLGSLCVRLAGSSLFDSSNELQLLFMNDTRSEFKIQESNDLLSWIDLSSGYSSSVSNVSVFTSYSYNRHFFRTVATQPLPAPAPIPADDLFFPYLTPIPRVTTVLSEETIDGILVRRFRMTSYEGRDDGSVHTNEIYAVLARAANLSQGPGILVCHGAGGSAEEAKAVSWAKLGFVALAPEFPGYASLAALQSISRVAGQPFTSQFLHTSPNAYASSAFDSVVAGLRAFNYVAAQDGVDQANVVITGASMGGYMATMLCGLLDVRVRSAFSLFGSGFFLDDSYWQATLLQETQAERDEWMNKLDAGARVGRIRAEYLLYAAANDQFFGPNAVMETLAGIQGEKHLCFSPGDNHQFNLPGGTSSGATGSWTTMEPVYLLSSLKPNRTPMPNVVRLGREQNKLTFSVTAIPPNARLWGFYSTDLADPRETRIWNSLSVTPNGSGFEMQLPPGNSQCDWIAGLTFSLSGGGSSQSVSLSSPVYREDFSQ
jgi:dienelactone hydrolase